MLFMFHHSNSVLQCYILCHYFVFTWFWYGNYYDQFIYYLGCIKHGVIKA